MKTSMFSLDEVDHGRPSLLPLRGAVHTVLVDEAAQAVESETLVPLCPGLEELRRSFREALRT